jgi:hypothetical protein
MSNAVKIIESYGVVAYKPAYAFIKGSDVVCAVMLSQLAYLCARYGEVCVTHSAILEQTGLSREQQDRAAKFWESVGVVKKTVKGLPAKIHYDVDFTSLCALVVGIPHVGNTQTQVCETRKPLYKRSLLEETKAQAPEKLQERPAVLAQRNFRAPRGTVASQPPTLEEWLAYRKAVIGWLSIRESEEDYDAVTAKGWKQSNGVPYVDWQAVARKYASFKPNARERILRWKDSQVEEAPAKRDPNRKPLLRQPQPTMFDDDAAHEDKFAAIRTEFQKRIKE